MGAVLVTGATAGIGEESARQLVRRGRRVLVHGRDEARAAAAVERIGGGEAVAADLGSFAEVRALAASVGELDALVDNAGGRVRDGAAARGAHAQSKIALMLLAREQAERWPELTASACSPGWIATKMGGAGGGPIARGADTPVWLVTGPALEGVSGRSFYERREERPNPQAEDAEARRRLWELAEAAVSAAG